MSLHDKIHGKCIKAAFRNTVCQIAGYSVQQLHCLNIINNSDDQDILILFFFRLPCRTQEKSPEMESSDGCNGQSPHGSLVTQVKRPEKWHMDWCEDDHKRFEGRPDMANLLIQLSGTEKEEVLVLARYLDFHDWWIRRKRWEFNRGNLLLNVISEWMSFKGPKATCGRMREAVQNTAEEVQR